MHKAKEADIKKFEKTQKKNKKRRLQQQPDVSDSEEEQESQATDRMRPRRGSIDIERRQLTSNRAMTTKPAKKKPDNTDQLILRDVDESEESAENMMEVAEVEDLRQPKKSQRTL